VNRIAVFIPDENSWKQVKGDRWAKCSSTFPEKPQDHKTINGVDCVTVEPEIRLFSATLGGTTPSGVVTNDSPITLTEPVQGYVLTMGSTAKHAGVREFEPLCTLTDWMQKLWRKPAALPLPRRGRRS